MSALATYTGELRAEVEQERAALRDLLELCGQVEVQDDESAADAATLVNEVKSRWRTLDEARKRVTGPLLEAKREVDSWFAPALGSLQTAERGLKSLLASYADRVAALRATERAEALEVAAASARAGDGETATAALEVAADAAARPRVDGATLREQWDFSIEDLSQVPREYLALNTIAVREALRAGVRSIPGLRVFSRTVVAAQVRR